jgi:hypothetical protein
LEGQDDLGIKRRVFRKEVHASIELNIKGSTDVRMGTALVVRKYEIPFYSIN